MAITNTQGTAPAGGAAQPGAQPAGTPAGGSPPTLPKGAGNGRPEWAPSGARGTADGGSIPIGQPSGDAGASSTPEQQPPQAKPNGEEKGQEKPVVGTGGTISPERVSQVRERARRAALREAFGTDDPAKIQQIKAQRAKEQEAIQAEREELARLREQEEARKRESMSEQEKLNADLEKARQEAERYKNEIETMKREAAFREQDQQVQSIASEFIDPEASEFVCDKFARHVMSLPKSKVKAMKPEDVQKWFRDFAAQHPKFARQAGDQPPAQLEKPKPKPQPRRVPVRTSKKPVGGKPSAQPQTGATQTPDRSGGKTVLPGRKDSMTKAELREHLSAKGMRGW